MEKIIKEFTVYALDELSDKAQQKAYSDWLSSFEYFWSSENEASLKAFEELFPVKVKDWSYGDYRSFISWEFKQSYNSFYDTEDIENLSGLRLRTYLINNYYTDIYKGKYYSKGKYIDGKYTYVSRRSKINFLPYECPFTGYCADNYLLEPIYAFIKNPDSSTTFYSLMEDCLSEWVKGCSEDYESSQEMECFIEDAQANEWKYLEDGTMY